MQLIMMCNFSFLHTYHELRLIPKSRLMIWMVKIVIIGYLTPFAEVQRR